MFLELNFTLKNTHAEAKVFIKKNRICDVFSCTYLLFIMSASLLYFAEYTFTEYTFIILF